MLVTSEGKAPVVLIPVNGLGNRLRAISGAYALSLLHRRPLIVAWEPEPHLPDDVFELFDGTGPVDFRRYMDVVEAGLLPNSETPLYLRETEGFITLRGYGKGEQRFIAALNRKMKTHLKLASSLRLATIFRRKHFLWIELAENSGEFASLFTQEFSPEKSWQKLLKLWGTIRTLV